MVPMTISANGRTIEVFPGDVKGSLTDFLMMNYTKQQAGMNNYVLLAAERLLDEEEETLTPGGIELLESMADDAMNFDLSVGAYGISYIQFAVLLAIEAGLWYRRKGFEMLPIELPEQLPA